MTVLHLLNNSDKLERGEVVERQDRLAVPFLEKQYPGGGPLGCKLAEEQPNPRTIKSHLPLCFWKDGLDKSPETKVIQTIRNPKDTLVSYFHFYRMNMSLGCFNGTWDEFFDLVKNDKIFFGDVCQSMADWYRYNNNRENSSIFVYEDMIKNLRGNVKKLADFLGCRVSDNVLDIISEKTTFNNMCNDPNLNVTGIPTFKQEISKFLRRGKVGDWKDYFSEEQNEYIENKCKKIFDPIGLKFKYETVP